MNTHPFGAEALRATPQPPLAAFPTGARRRLWQRALSVVPWELRILGISTLGLPLLTAVLFTGLALLSSYNTLHSGGTSAHAHHNIAEGMLFLLEFGVPPVAGLIAAHLATNNPAKELHLALPFPYAATTGLRLLLFTLWTSVVCACLTLLANAAGYWIAPRGLVAGQLIWAAPLLWFVVVGALLALALRSRIVSAALLGMLWLGEIAFHATILQNPVLQNLFLFLTIVEPNASYWLTNRLALIGMAAVLAALLPRLLRANEAVLSHEA